MAQTIATVNSSGQLFQFHPSIIVVMWTVQLDVAIISISMSTMSVIVAKMKTAVDVDLESEYVSVTFEPFHLLLKDILIFYH